jgi:DeoR family fructose operon transcriptional repressor
MYAEERQEAIAAMVISRGRASVAELAKAYDVTTETVRRDLSVLEDRNLVRRVHGGAVPADALTLIETVRRDLAALDKAGVVRRVHGGAVPVRALHLVEPGVGERESTRADYKDAIAAAATEFFPLSGASVLVDAGTTTARIAALVPTDRELIVVTNSVPIAARLAAFPSVSLQVLGGRVRGITQAAVGEQALRVLDTLRVDIAFIGTNAISARHGLSTPDSEEAAVKRAMVRCANYVVVAADSTKVGREDFVSFAPISSVDTLITDSEISDADRTMLTDEGVEVVIAGGPA